MLKFFFQLSRFQNSTDCTPIYYVYNRGFLNKKPMLHNDLAKNCKKFFRGEPAIIAGEKSKKAMKALTTTEKFLDVCKQRTYNKINNIAFSNCRHLINFGKSQFLDKD